jgi:RNA polymerase sigma-70 factor (ECF subfamily)
MTAPEPIPLEAIVRELSLPLRRYLEHYVGDRTLAEDLRQETLIRMAAGYSGFAGRSSPKTWAFAIANRVAADYFRLPERRAKMVDIDEAADCPDPEPSIGQRLVEAEMYGCVRQVIDSLPETFRAALILHDLEGLTAEQTAAACECSVATAKIRIHRARQRLKEALDRQCSFYHDDQGVFRCDRKPPVSSLQ